MSYLSDMHGKQNDDFVRGFLAAMDAFSVWRNGKRWIGSPERLLGNEMMRSVAELSEHPNDFQELIHRLTKSF